MVGFWRKIQAVSQADGSAGAGQPYPHPTTALSDDSTQQGDETPSPRYTWPLEMQVFEIHDENTCLVKPVIPTYVPVVWEPVCSVSESSTLAADGGTVAPIKAPYNSCFQGF